GTSSPSSRCTPRRPTRPSTRSSARSAPPPRSPQPCTAAFPPASGTTTSAPPAPCSPSPPCPTTSPGPNPPRPRARPTPTLTARPPRAAPSPRAAPLLRAAAPPTAPPRARRPTRTRPPPRSCSTSATSPCRPADWPLDRLCSRARVSVSDRRHDLLAVSDLYLVDLVGAQPPRLLREGTAELEHGPGGFAPDGTRALLGRHRPWTETTSLSTAVEVLDLSTGDAQEVWPELDHWVDPVWLDDTTLVATSDDTGRGSVWIGALTDPAPRRLAGGPAQQLAFSSASVAGGAVIAAASGIAVAPHPVRIDPATGTVETLPNPADEVDLPGTLAEVTATAEDGTDLRAWLRL